MNDEQQDEAPAATAQGEVVYLLKRLQEQLTFLERKVDVLVAQSKERERPAPAYDKERSYSKPSYGSPRPYSSERPTGAGRREGRPSYGGKPSYGSKPTGRPAYGSKPYGGGFAGKKKPFFKKEH